MSIEYLPNLGDKIDLSQFSKPRTEKGVKPEDYLLNLKKGLNRIAGEVNQEFPDFLDYSGRIALAGPEASSDQELVAAQEEGFCREAGKELKVWQTETEKNPANLTEMALTIMLHQFLKDDFIVARASKYDDYNHGVDQVIIDKKTGAIVCGFDEVIGHRGDDGGQKKEAKLRKIMAKGGASLKYGAQINEEGQLVRAAVQKIPTFYLSLSKEELASLLVDLKANPGAITPGETNIFNKFISSLTEQATWHQEFSGPNDSGHQNKIVSLIEKLKRPAHRLAA